MPFEIDSSGPIIRVELTGVVTNADLVELSRAADEIENAETIVRARITDLRPAVRFDIDFNGVAGFAAERVRRVFPNSFKSAIIAPDPARFGFARMFQTLNDHPRITLAIFPDEAEALAWVMAPGFAPPETAWSPSRRAPVVSG
jgi:hypothetical protein